MNSHLTDLAKSLTQIDDADLDAVLKQVQEIKSAKDWPKEIVVYVHGDEDSNWDTAKELGLSEEASLNFRHTAYEIGLVVSVTRDGVATLIGVKNGEGTNELSEPMGI